MSRPLSLVAAGCFCSALVVSGCGSKTPTAASPSPSQSTTPTRVIALSGNMAFGNIQVGNAFEAVLRISNTGTALLTITGMTGPAGYTSGWTSGTIPAGGFQEATIRFSPTAEQTYSGTLTLNGDQTSGTNTIAISGTGTRPPGPRTSFGAGQYLVGSDIAAGRYFTAPASGCYWERESGLGGSLGEILANNFHSFSAGQWIVDIAASDKAFKTESSCGTWSQTAKQPTSTTTIAQGMWLVGSQINPGTYRADAKSGCYWERLRGFSGTISSVIANNFSSSAGSQLVSISSGDSGFDTDADCGPWTRISSLTTVPVLLQSPIELANNRERGRRGR